MRVTSAAVTPVGADTLGELLRRQAEKYGDKVAFAYSDNGDDDGLVRLTYAELDRRARAVAATLQDRGAAGRRVLVFCRPGLEHIAGFFGCWYAGAIAVPVHETQAPRLSWAVPDAQPDFAVTGPALAMTVKTGVDAMVDLVGGRPLQWVLTDSGDADSWAQVDLSPDATAVLQYTSGATASPKSMPVTHRNVLCNVESLHRVTRTDEQDIGVCWLGHQNNMGLITAVIHQVYAGSTSFFMSPDAFAERPLRWLEAVSRRRANLTVGPNYAYALCVERSTPAERAALDLSCLAIVGCGAQLFSADDLRDFVDAFAAAGLRPETLLPTYGQTEATSTISASPRSVFPTVQRLDGAALSRDRVVDAAPGDAGVEVVSCGRLLDGLLAVTVDPETRLECGADEIGEIWVAGPNVVGGYWRRPEETEQTFNAFLADTGEGPFLRTGDLGFFRDDQLFITGRWQDIITFGGDNYYPGAIEASIKHCHPALSAGRAAVFALPPEPDRTAQLVVVQEVTGPVSETELADIVAAIRDAVTARYGLQVDSVALVPPPGLPTTATGKIQRGVCREQFMQHRLDTIAEWHASVPPPVPAESAREAILNDDLEAARARLRWESQQL